MWYHVHHLAIFHAKAMGGGHSLSNERTPFFDRPNILAVLLNAWPQATFQAENPGLIPRFENVG